MYYLIKKGDRYYYNRRVPKDFQKYDPRRFVRIALKTDSKKTAIREAIARNDEVENYWAGLIRTGSTHSSNDFKTIVDNARLLGFAYRQAADVAQLPLQQILERLKHLEKTDLNVKQVETVLGGVKPPAVLLSDCLSRFWDYSKNKTIDKSPDQIRKWENPRMKAMKNFIKVVGNKPVTELTRDDTLKFRDWWIERMDKQGLVSGSANKDIIYSKTIIESINENLKLNLDTNHLFRKLVLTKDDAQKRMPFETEFITSTLLNPKNLSGLPDQARCVLMAIAETGAGIAEQVGLLPEDIVLDADIPHISITPRSKKALKTKYRRRTIPLVGYALEAFKECPRGFYHYRDRPDALSSVLSNHLHVKNLLPSKQHTVYSLRHSFQDRLLAVNAPDRVQADLMGHKFSRPAYGQGATLDHKLEWLNKIVLNLS